MTKNSIVSRVKLTIKQDRRDQYYHCILCRNSGHESQISLFKIVNFKIYFETCHAIFYQLGFILIMQFIDSINNMEKLSEFLDNPIIKTKSLNKFGLVRINLLVKKKHRIIYIQWNKKKPIKKVRKVKIKEDSHKIFPKDQILSVDRKKSNDYLTNKKICVHSATSFTEARNTFDTHNKT